MKKTRIFLIVILLIIAILAATVQFGQDAILEKAIDSNEQPKGNGYEISDTSPGLKPTYNEKDIEPLTLSSYVKHQGNIKNAKAKGRLVIPSVNIDLKIYEGLNNTHLILGACEQRPRSEVVAGGIGNYVLAAHSSFSDDNAKFLFTPLRKVKDGDIILISDQDNLYVYKTEYAKIFKRDNPEPLNESFEDSRVTLYTCLSRERFSEGRFVVRGLLIDTIKLEDVKDSEYASDFPF